MYAVLLWVNTTYCLILGLLLILNQGIFVPNPEPGIFSWVRTLGFSFLPLGTLSLIMMIFKSRDVYLVGFTILSIFHMGMTVAQTLNFMSAFASLSFVLAHGLLAAGMILASARIAGRTHKG